MIRTFHFHKFLHVWTSAFSASHWFTFWNWLNKCNTIFINVINYTCNICQSVCCEKGQWFFFLLCNLSELFQFVKKMVSHEVVSRQRRWVINSLLKNKIIVIKFNKFAGGTNLTQRFTVWSKCGDWSDLNNLYATYLLFINEHVFSVRPSQYICETDFMSAEWVKMIKSKKDLTEFFV